MRHLTVETDAECGVGPRDEAGGGGDVEFEVGFEVQGPGG